MISSVSPKSENNKHRQSRPGTTKYDKVYTVCHKIGNWQQQTLLKIFSSDIPKNEQQKFWAWWLNIHQVKASHFMFKSFQISTYSNIMQGRHNSLKWPSLLLESKPLQIKSNTVKFHCSEQPKLQLILC